MRRSRSNIYFYTILIVILLFPKYISNSKADIVPVDYRGTACFVPVENTHLIMTNANVVIDVNYRESSNKIYLHFNGNYTIYNPNVSQFITLGAPFSADFKNIEDNCVIKVKENEIPFEVTEQDINDIPWDQYYDFYFNRPFERKFLVINVSIPANDSLSIEYIFDSYIANPNYRQAIDIYYDVGTSRAWNGPISERVEFKVVGKQPNYYSDYRENRFEYNCTISNIENGKSYVWEWVNETINVNGVYISYGNGWVTTLARISPFIIIPSVFGVPIIIIKLNKRRKRKKRDLLTCSHKTEDDKYE